ncbi:TPA: hypothetical protein ACH9S1_005453, partial [Escherichia coli]
RKRKNKKKQDVTKIHFADFSKNPAQPCGNPVFMRVRRISPVEKPCVCAQPGYGSLPLPRPLAR